MRFFIYWGITLLVFALLAQCTNKQRAQQVNEPLPAIYDSSEAAATFAHDDVLHRLVFVNRIHVFEDKTISIEVQESGGEAYSLEHMTYEQCYRRFGIKITN